MWYLHQKCEHHIKHENDMKLTQKSHQTWNILEYEC